jgi:hypothetical protein
VAVGSGDEVTVAGTFEGTIDVAGAVLTALGDRDTFVARYSADGTLLSAQSFGGTSIVAATSVVVDVDGSFVLAGDFTGAVDFGGGNLATGGDADVFIAKFAADGTHAWSLRAGGAREVGAHALAVAADSGVVVGGTFHGTASFGGADLVSAGAGDGFVASYDANGNHVWSAGVGGSGSDAVLAVALDESGRVVATGRVEGDVLFGGTPRTAIGGQDGFMAVFAAADGAIELAGLFGGAGDDAGTAIVRGIGSVFILGGTYSGDADLFGTVLQSRGARDIFLVQFAFP